MTSKRANTLVRGIVEYNRVFSKEYECCISRLAPPFPPLSLNRLWLPILGRVARDSQAREYLQAKATEGDRLLTRYLPGGDLHSVGFAPRLLSATFSEVLRIRYVLGEYEKCFKIANELLSLSHSAGPLPIWHGLSWVVSPWSNVPLKYLVPLYRECCSWFSSLTRDVVEQRCVDRAGMPDDHDLLSEEEKPFYSYSLVDLLEMGANLVDTGRALVRRSRWKYLGSTDRKVAAILPEALLQALGSFHDLLPLLKPEDSEDQQRLCHMRKQFVRGCVALCQHKTAIPHWDSFREKVYEQAGLVGHSSTRLLAHLSLRYPLLSPVLDWLWGG